MSDGLVARLTDLAESWTAEAQIVAKRGLGTQAVLIESFADELLRAIELAQLESLSLKDAARESGLSQSTLRRAIRVGRITNAGGEGQYRIRRRDLPRKAPNESRAVTDQPLHLKSQIARSVVDSEGGNRDG